MIHEIILHFITIIIMNISFVGDNSFSIVFYWFGLQLKNT